MIISASRRTDIPAFYSDWFMKRIRQGECLVINPFNRNQIKRVSLLPADVDMFVFWTRHAAPLMPYLDELEQYGFRYYFQYTLTNYPSQLELKTPPLKAALDTIRALAHKIGRERIIWRYDPILLSEVTPPDYHRRNFQELARELKGVARRCVISLYDDYAKSRFRLAQEASLRPMTKAHDKMEAVLSGLMPDLVEIAEDYQFELVSCAEDLSTFGIRPGKCVDDDLINQVFGLSIQYRKDPVQRQACRCMLSQDIGRYNTCLFACQYCYATRNFEQANRYFSDHDSESPYL